ncbi:MAG TPA: hypothetical protein VJ743_21550 [Albitalea sp.]|nr:hypothetical protein [Albitalea sp.]
MNATSPNTLPDRLKVVLTLAHVLQRLERGAGPVGADQYRSVAVRLSEELGRQPADAALQAILDAHPAAAEVYENLNYRHAGLCRAPLERALTAELRAREAIQRAARRESDRSPG